MLDLNSVRDRWPIVHCVAQPVECRGSRIIVADDLYEHLHRRGLHAPCQVHYLLGIQEWIQKRVFYDGDCSHHRKCYLETVIAGQMMGGFLTPHADVFERFGE